MHEAELERRLFTAPSFEPKPTRGFRIGITSTKELKRHGVTLLLLWEEYRAQHVDGYGYSRFCDLYGLAQNRFGYHAVDACRRREAIRRLGRRHGAGVRRRDGPGASCPYFVAVLGASNYTYAEARWSEALPDWIGAHVNALAAIAGVPGALVCDNLKAGVTATCPTTTPRFCRPGRGSRATRPRWKSAS
jgi:transposase